jgi:hypothetical protein
VGGSCAWGALAERGEQERERERETRALKEKHVTQEHVTEEHSNEEHVELGLIPILNWNETAKHRSAQTSDH